MIPSIEKVIKMKERFPLLDNYIARLEERYIYLCKIIDSSSVSDNVKTMRKNSYYIFLMTLKKLLADPTHPCVLLITSNSVVINDKTYNLKFSYDLLLILFNNENLIQGEYFGDPSIIYTVSLNSENERKRTN